MSELVDYSVIAHCSSNKDGVLVNMTHVPRNEVYSQLRNTRVDEVIDSLLRRRSDVRKIELTVDSKVLPILICEEDSELVGIRSSDVLFKNFCNGTLPTISDSCLKKYATLHTHLDKSLIVDLVESAVSKGIHASDYLELCCENSGVIRRLKIVLDHFTVAQICNVLWYAKDVLLKQSINTCKVVFPKLVNLCNDASFTDWVQNNHTDLLLLVSRDSEVLRSLLKAYSEYVESEMKGVV